MITAAAFLAELDAHRSEAERLKYKRYFKHGWEGFIGVRMGQVFALAKAAPAMPIAELERLLESPIHEARAGALRIMANQAAHKQATPETRQALYALYLRRHDRIDNWDLVDLAACDVVGAWLADKPRDVLYTLAASPVIWERRTPLYAAMAFFKHGQFDDAIALATQLKDDPEDLIRKAVGTLLREVGRRDRPRLLAFLDEHRATLPRVTLRVAIELLEPALRKAYLA